MKSARRRQLAEKNKVNPKSWGVIFKFFLLLTFVFLGLIFFKFQRGYWDGYNKISFVYQKPSGDIGVTVLDPVLGEDSTIVIPGDTEVNVARNYGTLRIKNVMQLGVNEKLGGDLLAQTVTGSFLFPTTLWIQNEPDSFLKFIFSPKLTNISFTDRVMIGIFRLKVKSLDRTEIDLGKSQFLKKQILTDGVGGYIVNGPISERLTIYFSDNSFAEKNLKLGIVDNTGKPGLSDRVGAILEVLGGKVVSLDRIQANDNLDCEVYGKDADAVRKISVLFSCRKTGQESNLDLEIKIGPKFAKRF